MQASRFTLLGGIVGIVGVGLLLFEAIRAVVMHTVLSTTSQALMWTGLGVMAAGGVLLVFGVWLGADDSR